MKKNINYMLSFLIPILLIIISLLISNKITNFLFYGDMDAQYIGFFSEFQEILKGKASIFYSFGSGLGTSFLMNYYYYLGSPLNLVLIFFSNQNLLYGLSVIILLKCGLSSLTMNIYLEKYFISPKQRLLLSICYSMMQYFVVFYTNVMWLDALYLMPLLLKFIDDFIDKNIEYKYIITFVILVVSNYYISYMCLIFLVLYFFINIIGHNNKKTKILNFIKINIIGCLLCSYILVPAIINILSLMKNRGIDFIQITNIADILKIVINLISQIFPFSSESFDFSNSYIPNIYCSLYVVILNIVYFCNKKIIKKEKILTSIIFLIFFISFFTNTGNFLFNGFSYPFGHYFRYSFLFSLWMIVIAAKALEKIDIKNIINTKSIKPMLVVDVLFVIVLSLLDYINFFMIAIIVIINLYIVFLSFIDNKIFKYFMFLLVVLELFLNFYYTNNGLIYDYKLKDDPVEILYNCPETNNSVRVIYNKKQRNSSLLCKTLGSEYSSSNINYDIMTFYQKIGAFVSSSHYYLTNNNTDLMKKLLSIKYEQKDYGYKIYNSLSVGYMINSDLALISEKNPFEYQNSLVSSMIGEEVKPLKPYKKIKNLDPKNEMYQIDSKRKNYYYVWHDSRPFVFSLSFSKIYANGEKIHDYNAAKTHYGIQKFNKRYKNNVINFKIIENIDAKKYREYYNIKKHWLYYEDKKITDYAISELSKNQLKVTSMKKNILEGNINVNDRKILFLSIPYEKGWNIYVDGKKVEYFKLYGAFIGINLTEGHHEIKMKFYPIGLKTGIIISIITILNIIALNFFRKKKYK